jgi:molybdenum cofactor synthesis domain-containing protein
MSDKIPTAAILVIGDEILSGRTKDRNIGFIADRMTDLGIDLKEVRIVADQKSAIIEAVQALRARYSVVFTTGGIGPTHDDITAETVAEAFGVAAPVDERAVAILQEHYDRTGREMTEARLRMARIPEGADLIENTVSGAPGFSIGNVHVMAGVPSIMQAMLDAVTPRLPTSIVMQSETIEANRGETDVSAMLADVQAGYPQVQIGSYPYHNGEKYTTRIVARSRDSEMLASAVEALKSGLKAS